MAEHIEFTEEEMEAFRKMMASLREDVKLAFSDLKKSLQSFGTGRSSDDSVDLPVEASSNAMELVTSSAEQVEPPVSVPAIGESLRTPHLVSDDTKTVAHAFCSTECQGRDTKDLTPAAISEAAPKTPAADVDTITVLEVAPDLAPAFTSAAPSSTPTATMDIILASATASDITTGSRVFQPRHSVADPVLVKYSPSMMHLYGDSEFGRLCSPEHITSKVLLHRPMPGPSFNGVGAAGEEARPRPWPSFMETYGCKFPGKVIERVLRGISDCSSAITSSAYGNLCAYTIPDTCIAIELRCFGVEPWNEMLGRSKRSYVQSSYTIQMQVSAVRTEQTVSRTGVFYSALSYIIGLAVNLELQPSWILLVHRNFSGLPSYMHIEIDARLSSFHWNPAILNMRLKELVLQGLKAYGSNGFVFLQLSNMSKGSEHMDSSIITAFSCPNGSVVCTSFVWDGCGSTNNVVRKLTWRCTYDGFPLRVVARNSELRLSSVGSTLITVLHVLSAGGNLAAMICKYLVVDITDCTGSLLSVGFWIAGYPEFSVQTPVHYFSASESVSWPDIKGWNLMDLHCSIWATPCWSHSQGPGHYLDTDQRKMLVTATGYRTILACIQNEQNNSRMLLLPWVLEHSIVATYLGSGPSFVCLIMHRAWQGLNGHTSPIRLSLIRKVNLTGNRSLLGLQGSAYYSHSDQSCKSDWKQGCREFSQSDHTENLALIPLSKLEFDGVTCFHQGQSCARYQCNTRALAPNMQTILEHWRTYLLPLFMTVEKSEDLSSIKSLEVLSGTIFGMPVAKDGKVNQRWKILWEPGDCKFVLASCEGAWTISETTPQHCSDQNQGSSLVRACVSIGCGQAHSQEGRNAQIRVQLGLDCIAFLSQTSLSYDCYLDKAQSSTTFSDLITYHDDTNKIREVHRPWDPGKSAFRHPIKTTAWGQAVFQEGRNVMGLANILRVGLVPWASSDGLDPSKRSEATYTQEDASNTHPFGSRIEPLCSSSWCSSHLLPLAAPPLISLPPADCIPNTSPESL